MYQAILFSRDGDWVTDFIGKTKKEVIDQLVDIGSKWYFYPLHFITTKHSHFTTPNQRIVDVPDDPDIYEMFRDKSIRTVSNMIKQLTDEEFAFLIGM